MSSAYSGSRGSRQTRSPAPAPAAVTAPHQAAAVPLRPAEVEPSRTATAPAPRGGGGAALAPAAARPQDPRVARPDRDAHGAGQGREVDEPLRALLACVREAVGEHEARLGVRVVDLDRHAGARGDDVAGARG